MVDRIQSGGTARTAGMVGRTDYCWAGQIIVEHLYTDPVHGSSIYPLATLSAAAASID